MSICRLRGQLGKNGLAVGVEGMARPLSFRGRLAQRNGIAGLRRRTEFGIEKCDDATAGPGVFVVQPLGGRLADGNGTACFFVDNPLPLRGGTRFQDLPQQAPQPSDVLRITSTYAP